jgi:hypothetical protein
MPQDPSQMAQMLSMLQLVADKTNPLNRSLNPGMGTEGGGRVGNARAGVRYRVVGKIGDSTRQMSNTVGPSEYASLKAAQAEATRLANKVKRGGGPLEQYSIEEIGE